MPETKTLAAAPRPAAGGTGLLTYRPWRGRLGGPSRGVWAIARTGLSMLLRRWTFWGLYAGCLLIFLFFFFGQYLLVWIGTQLQEENVRFLFGSRIEPARLVQLLGETLKLNGSGVTFRSFINVESSMVEIVLAFAGSLLIGNDFLHGSLPFYLSKPLSRWHYVLGKSLAVAVFVNAMTTLLAVCLWVQYGLLDGWEYFADNLYLLGGILAYGAVLTVVLSLLLVATATWLRKTVPLVMVWTTIFLFAPPLTETLYRLRGEEARWKLLNLWNDLTVLGTWCLRLPEEPQMPPPVEAALVLGAVCVACLIYLNRRIRAVEIV
jgi:ABC-2 type transport system permease protein